MNRLNTQTSLGNGSSRNHTAISVPLNRRRGGQRAGTAVFLVAVNVGAAAAVSGGCSDKFSSCEAHRNCPHQESAGGAGASGDGGAESPNATGGMAAEGGSGGVGDIGGSSGGGGSSGVSGEETGGAGHSGGAAGNAPMPACEDDVPSCGIPGTGERRVCRDGAWVADEECPAAQVCSGDTAACVAVAAGCADKNPGEAFCEQKERVLCSEDLSHATRETCDESCNDGECVPATCGDRQVQGKEECDDGNEISGDGCSNACQWGPKELVLGGETSCVLFGNGWAKCWGLNRNGMLGLGDSENRGDAPNEMGEKLPFIKIGPSNGGFTALGIGPQHACGISNGTVWCWGSNLSGTLGIESTANESVLTPAKVDVGGRAKAVACGIGFTCALLDSGQVKCWGGYDLTIGDEPGEMGTNLQPEVLGGTAVGIDAGNDHACALLDSGAVNCWGADSFGQLGRDRPQDPYDGKPVEVDLGPGLQTKVLALGGYHTCALTSVGLKCWGYNVFGALGYGHANNIGAEAYELGSLLPLVPVTTSDNPIVDVSAMKYGTCAILRSNAVKCWGYAEAGVAQPALAAAVGNIGDQPDEVSQLPPILLGTNEGIRSFDTGENHACILFDSGDIKCWGFNQYGELGLGHTNSVGDAENELGPALRPTIVL